MEDWQPKLQSNPSEYANIIEHIIVKFFSWSSGSLVFYRKNLKPIIYTRIWKCANEGIGMNLHILTVADRTPLSKGIVHEAKTQASLNAILKTMYQEDFLMSSNVTVFTFVREPFSKFISGFTESVFRTSPLLTLRKTEPPLILNITLAKKYITDIFDCKLPLVQLDHIYPISGALFTFNIHIVGHLDHLVDDWNTMVKPAYNITIPYNERHGSHPTAEIHPRAKASKNQVQSVDPSNVRPTLRHLFQKEKKYKRAFCHMLLIDYICLPEYPLPMDCLFLNETMHRARRALERGEQIPHLYVREKGKGGAV